MFKGSVAGFCERVQYRVIEAVRHNFTAVARKHQNPQFNTMGVDLQRLKFVGDASDLKIFKSQLNIAVLRGYANDYDQGQFVGSDKAELERKCGEGIDENYKNIKGFKSLSFAYLDENKIPCSIELWVNATNPACYSILHVRNTLAAKRADREMHYYSSIHLEWGVEEANESAKSIPKELAHILHSGKVLQLLTSPGEKHVLTKDGKLNVAQSIEQLQKNQTITMPFADIVIDDMTKSWETLCSEEGLDKVERDANRILEKWIDANKSDAIHVALALDVMAELGAEFNKQKAPVLYELACLADHYPNPTPKQFNAPLVDLSQQLTEIDHHRLSQLLISFKKKRENVPQNYLKHTKHPLVSSFLKQEKEITKVIVELEEKVQKLEEKKASEISEERQKSIKIKINALTVSLLFIEKAHENLLTTAKTEFAKPKPSKLVIDRALSTFCHVSARTLQNTVLKNEKTKEHDSA